MKRTGLLQFIRFVRECCRVYSKWSERMVLAVNNNNNLTSQQKANIINAIQAVVAACEVLDAAWVVWS